MDNKELSGVTATYKSNDRADGTDVERELTVPIWSETALTGAPTAIIASPTVTPLMIPVTGETMVVANSEYSVNK